jgi:hypothetical protein
MFRYLVSDSTQLDPSLALLPVSGGGGPMAGGGLLYLFERKGGKWSLQTAIAMWAV